MNPIRSYRSVLIALLAGGGVAPAYAQTYQVTPLGSLGGTVGAAGQDINTAGEVVGWSDTELGQFHAFYWTAGTMVDLGTLPGDSESVAYAINDSGVIVGYSLNRDTGFERAVKWQRDSGGQWQITPLGTLGGNWSIAWDVNNNGVIVGTSQIAAGQYHGFILQNGTMTDLGTPGFPSTGSYSEAWGLNNAGHVVGYAYRPLFGPDHAWYFDGTTNTDITPAGQFSFARGTDLNNLEVASGIRIQTGGGSDGFEAAIWSMANGWTELGVLPGTTESEAWALNDSGVVVGRSFDVSIPDYRGFAYVNGSLIDLSQVPGAAAPITEAIAVNNAGKIIANADSQSGVSSYILTPAGASCYANCDGSTVAPVLNVADFTCFLQRFAAGESYANCDNSTTVPTLNVADFTCFLQSFAAGCP
jgi:probable HAF family extracellular repeat protein